MKKILFFALLLVTSGAMSAEPTHCGKEIGNLFAKLIINDELGGATNVEPDQNYKHKQHNNLCVIKALMSSDGQWTAHRHNNGQDVIFQLTNFKSGSKSYYGPFKTAYNKPINNARSAGWDNSSLAAAPFSPASNCPLLGC